jgi:sugar-specific transcriptional regulator TrmB
MAQREREKSKRAGSPPADSTAGLSDAVQRLEARARTLERERDGLKTELDAARVRIRQLEDARAQAVNRIDWVIDSLQNVIDKTP